ncbi:2-polyprenyl-3-methyl-6-methoxy-1,4-benzoquinone monooxygenase [Denitromonas iodatirespirans]|uniref:3-demethoxyubiquinol 3-hydroxylase n=1 Tax=Denitromonas iodatirespirans TaxID=2795389 RepID=A0A944DTB1_DENI1|nr:2-polyprenyl-3-methyl-6-methoxy-1,4-benzoquinone monooxygenase [Denitromonas iodatirespirans]MBT0964069.1 2-polyprenyl-3-methyl-6-methoxy-1,4-benzoquinone monooxygenase [Denitromonas iodatirespirans]
MIDSFILHFDRALRTVFAPASTRRPWPGGVLPEPALADPERKHAAALMRVNHVGEICAQALYQGQALMSRQPEVTRALGQAADEETEHLAWTERRIVELGGRKSLLNPLWYGGALTIGVLAGRFGEAWNLGFLAETERQVESHLTSHLSRLPGEDLKSRAIVQQMVEDERAHADKALELGGVPLPSMVRAAMRGASRVMTTTAYWV